MDPPTIDRQRMLADLDRLNEFGRLDSGGVERVAFGEADRAARDWLRGELEALPVEVRDDSAGNTLARFAPGDPARPAIGFGSHSDTVPNGGCFDGALGVIAGLACLRALAQAEAVTRHPLELINFAAEEATTTAGTFGSRAMAGLLSDEEIHAAGMDPTALTGSRRPPGDLAAFLELHIEQGDQLERSHADIGVVEGIAALRRRRFHVAGTAAHAGSTPMAGRDDALVKAAHFVLDAGRLASVHDARVTIGEFQVEDGAAAVVPASVRGTLDLRAASDESLVALEAALDRAEIERSPATRKPAAESDPRLLDTIDQACKVHAASTLRMTSFAGHDARSMAALAPVAMLFVPSRGGISHSPGEFTTPEHCLLGAEVLLTVILEVDASIG